MQEPNIYYPHSKETKISLIEDYYQATFIDPGTVSCGIRIVKYYKLTKIIKVIYFDILNFGKEISEIIINANNILFALLHFFINSHFIIIEKQPFLRRDVFSCSQHIISFLTINIKNKNVNGIIVEVDPKLKTVWIGGPANEKENGGVSIKKWSKQKAIDVSILRNDQVTLNILKDNKKYKAKAREDLSDTVCYEYAWWSYIQKNSKINKYI